MPILGAGHRQAVAEEFGAVLAGSLLGRITDKDRSPRLQEAAEIDEPLILVGQSRVAPAPGLVEKHHRPEDVRHIDFGLVVGRGLLLSLPLLEQAPRPGEQGSQLGPPRAGPDLDRLPRWSVPRS